MNKSVCLYISVFFTATLSAQTPGNTKSITLPSKDSFRTAELLFLTPEKQLLYYQNAENILPTNKIEAGTKKHRLIEAPVDLSDISFRFKDTVRTMNDFIYQTKAVGIIVLKNDTILFEKYNGIEQNSKWINFSVAKSVTSLLYGAAIKDGYIRSLDEKLPHYIPELAGSAYDSVSLKHLLQMSSGVAWIDDPGNRESDLVKVGRLEATQGWPGIVKYLSQLKPLAVPGTKFNYNTIETSLAAIALNRVIGKPLANYLSEKIWKPFGMHADANWVKSRSLGIELGGCCISASLRDYALLGLFALNNGIDLDGKQVLAPGWMQESTSSSRSNPGYGYYWWLSSTGRYFASGAFGQQVEIDPSQRIVVAIQSYWPTAFSDYYVGYIDAMIEAIISKVKK
jgi:CubicO group peptidase (beta-lactamase class C family)